VVVQQPLSQAQHRRNPGVGQLVVDDPVLAAGGDEPAPAQAGQVGDRGLGLAELAGHLAGGQFPLGREQPEDAPPGWVTQGAEVLGDQIGAGRGGRQAEQDVGLPRFDGQGWWLGQAACLRTSWSVVSNSSGVM
jgi:hypothetical protein